MNLNRYKNGDKNPTDWLLMRKFVGAQTANIFRKGGFAPNVIKLTNLSRFVVG